VKALRPEYRLSARATETGSSRSPWAISTVEGSCESTLADRASTRTSVPRFSSSGRSIEPILPVPPRPMS